MRRATGTSQLAQRSAMRCMGACLFSASCTMRISFCRELSSPTFVAVISMEPNRLMVPQNTSSPIPLSTGRDSPVIIDWSTEVSPPAMIPSTGMLSPGRILRRSPFLISSAEIISSLPSRSLRPIAGARLMSFFKPFLARLVVASSRSAPMAMIKATSPAANRSPMAIAANIAMLIKRADEILLMPGLWIIRQMDRYKSGMPQMTTVTQAGSKGSRGNAAVPPPNSSARCGARSMSRKAPPTIVMGSPARKSLSFFTMIIPPLIYEGYGIPDISAIDKGPKVPYNSSDSEHLVLNLL